MSNETVVSAGAAESAAASATTAAAAAVLAVDTATAAKAEALAEFQAMGEQFAYKGDKGDKGDTGTQGDTGAKGDTGASAVLVETGGAYPARAHTGPAIFVGETNPNTIPGLMLDGDTWISPDDEDVNLDLMMAETFDLGGSLALAKVRAEAERYERRGVGTPEGSVAAPVGAYYTDTAITNGALRWAKVTGTGTTGWKCITGDTGWRLVTPLIAGYLIRVKRTEAGVTWVVSGNNGVTAAALGQICSVPVGWQPDNQPWNRIASHFYRHGGAGGQVLNMGNATAFSDSLYVNGSGLPDSASAAYLMYPTSQAWPTALLGTAV